MSTRRVFMLRAAVGAVAVTSLRGNAQSQTLPMLAETDPQAQNLGYVTVTTKVHKNKYPKHEPSQKCSNCQLFQGKETDAMGGCPLFAGKQVVAGGWCSAWAKKAKAG